MPTYTEIEVLQVQWIEIKVTHGLKAKAKCRPLVKSHNWSLSFLVYLLSASTSLEFPLLMLLSHCALITKYSNLKFRHLLHNNKQQQRALYHKFTPPFALNLLLGHGSSNFCFLCIKLFLVSTSYNLLYFSDNLKLSL